MTRAFILMLDTGSDTDFPSIAEDVSSDLTAAGHNVVYVHVFAGDPTGIPPAPAPTAPFHIPTPTPTIPFV